jgi:hypothetical protein
MTRAFDLAAKNSPNLFEHLSEPIQLNQLQVSLVPVKEIRRAIVTGHYSGVMPDACQEAFAAYTATGLLAAAVAYGPGGNSATFNAIIPGTNNKDAREMIRAWCHPDSPKNTASFVISKTLRMLPKQVRLVVTFADTGQQHLGTIYQALNFRYLGKSSEGTRYVDSSGIEVTSRLANVYRMRNLQRFGHMTLKQIREELGWTPVVSHPKHRYAIGVGIQRHHINSILDKISHPYPKEKMNERD